MSFWPSKLRVPSYTWPKAPLPRKVCKVSWSLETLGRLATSVFLNSRLWRVEVLIVDIGSLWKRAIQLIRQVVMQKSEFASCDAELSICHNLFYIYTYNIEDLTVNKIKLEMKLWNESVFVKRQSKQLRSYYSEMVQLTETCWRRGTWRCRCGGWRGVRGEPGGRGACETPCAPSNHAPSLPRKLERRVCKWGFCGMVLFGMELWVHIQVASDLFIAVVMWQTCMTWNVLFENKI